LEVDEEEEGVGVSAEDHSTKGVKGGVVAHRKSPAVESLPPQPLSLLNSATSRLLHAEKVPASEEQPEAEQGVSFAEAFERDFIYRPPSDTDTNAQPVPPWNETPASAASCTLQDPNPELGAGSGVRQKMTPIASADESQRWRHVNDPISSQMVEMENCGDSESQKLPAAALETPAPEKSQEEEKNSATFAANSLPSSTQPGTRVGSKSQRNLCTQGEVGSGDDDRHGLFTQSVDQLGTDTDSDSGGGNGKELKRLIVPFEDETTDEMNTGQTSPLENSAAAADYGGGSQPQSKRRRRSRTRVSQGPQGWTKTMFPHATYDRIIRQFSRQQLVFDEFWLTKIRIY